MTAESMESRHSAGRRMGDGDMPSELDGLNWSFLLWGGLWAVVYGAWSWLAVMLGLVTAYLAVDVFLRSIGMPLQAAVAASVIYRLLWYAVVVILSYRANRLVWERERRRVARANGQSTLRPAPLVADYLASQRRWAWYGLGFFAAGVLASQLIRTPVVAVQSHVGDAVGATVLVGLLLFERVIRRPAPQS